MQDVGRRRWAPRLALILAHVLIVTVVTWLLLGEPVPAGAPSWLGIDTGDETRRSILAVLAIAYLARFLVTTLFLLRRPVPWREVAAVAPWLALLHGMLAWTGGTNARPLAAFSVGGIALFLTGALLGPVSEWMRLVWKRRAENRGHLYTGGPFRAVMHPNYLGDVLLFAGWALVAGRLLSLCVPALVLLGFVYMHVPTLDRYLAGRYGQEFRAYSARTAHLIPGVW